MPNTDGISDPKVIADDGGDHEWDTDDGGTAVILSNDNSVAQTWIDTEVRAAAVRIATLYWHCFLQGRKMIREARQKSEERRRMREVQAVASPPIPKMSCVLKSILMRFDFYQGKFDPKKSTRELKRQFRDLKSQMVQRACDVHPPYICSRCTLPRSLHCPLRCLLFPPSFPSPVFVAVTLLFCWWRGGRGRIALFDHDAPIAQNAPAATPPQPDLASGSPPQP